MSTQLIDPNFVTNRGWDTFRARSVALNEWVARQEQGGSVAQGQVDTDLADEEALIRALFQRWTTTLEGILEVQLELGDVEGLDAVTAAYQKTMNHKPAYWRILDARSDQPLVAQMVRRQHLRMGTITGLTRTVASKQDVADQVATAVRDLRPHNIGQVVSIWSRARAALRPTARFNHAS